MQSNHKYKFIITYPTRFYAEEVGRSLTSFAHYHHQEYAYIDRVQNIFIIEISKYFDRLCDLLVSAKKYRILEADEEALKWLDKYIEQNDYNPYMEDYIKEIIVRDLAEAWRSLDAELIVRHLASDFRFKSMWVNESLDRDRYAKYLRDQFDEIRLSGQLGIREVPEHYAIAISKNGYEPAYYIAKIRNGAIVKVDWTKFLK